MYVLVPLFSESHKITIFKPKTPILRLHHYMNLKRMDVLCIICNVVTLHVEYEVYMIQFNILKCWNMTHLSCSAAVTVIDIFKP